MTLHVLSLFSGVGGLEMFGDPPPASGMPLDHRVWFAMLDEVSPRFDEIAEGFSQCVVASIKEAIRGAE